MKSKLTFNYLYSKWEGISLDCNQQYESTTIVRLTMRNTQKNKNLIFIFYLETSNILKFISQLLSPSTYVAQVVIH